jgi:hypothetical protein
MAEIRGEPGYGAGLVISALLRRLGTCEVVLTQRDMEAAPLLQWWTTLDPVNGARVRLSIHDPIECGCELTAADAPKNGH